MKIELLNPHIIKILISLRKEDSISSISKRIDLSYGWTYKWIKELIKEGILKEKWRGFTLNEKDIVYRRIIKFLKESLNEINFYYSALQLFGIEYCLTKTDAVYIWTDGGYNIARYKEYYPIFLKIKDKDYKIFLDYCKRLKLNINSNKKIFYAVEVVKEIHAVNKNNFYVEPLEKTIDFMQKNIYNFEPALEIISEIYGKKLNIKYKEVNYL